MELACSIQRIRGVHEMRGAPRLEANAGDELRHFLAEHLGQLRRYWRAWTVQPLQPLEERKRRYDRNSRTRVELDKVVIPCAGIMRSALPAEVLFRVDSRSDDHKRVGAMSGDALTNRMGGLNDPHLRRKSRVRVDLHAAARES